MKRARRRGASPGSRVRCAWAACPGRARRTGPPDGARAASPSPCTPATRPPRSRAGSVDRVVQHRVARLLVRGVGVDQLVEGPLGVEHHRPQLARRVQLHPGLLVAELLQPERVGQALGGVDREHRGRLSPARPAPRRSRRTWWSSRPRPIPAQITTSFRAIRFVHAHSLRSTSAESVSMSSGPSSGVSRNGRLATGASTPRLSRRTCERCDRVRFVGGQRRLEGRPRGRAAGAVHGRHRLGLGPDEALGQHCVHEDPGQVHAQLVPDLVLQVDGLVHRHLLRQRHGHDRRLPGR